MDKDKYSRYRKATLKVKPQEYTLKPIPFGNGNPKPQLPNGWRERIIRE